MTTPDDVEADAVPGRFGFPGVFAGDAQQVGALIVADGALRRPEIGRFPRLYFDEDQRLAIPGDQVRFGVAGGKPIVAGDDDDSRVRAKEAMGKVLSAAAKSQRTVSICGDGKRAAASPKIRRITI